MPFISRATLSAMLPAKRKYHWHCLAYRSTNEWGYMYLRREKQSLTRGDIEGALVAGAGQVVVSCSYLGYMSEADFTD